MDKKTIKIGFTGTRSGMTDLQKQKVEAAFKTAIEKSTEVVFIHGDCIGADHEAHKIALELGLSIEIYPCDLETQRAFSQGAKKTHKVNKPLVRNHNIVDDSDIMLACPSGMKEQLRSGTWATIRYAAKQKKKMVIFWPKGD